MKPEPLAYATLPELVGLGSALDRIATALEAQAETVDYSFDMPAHRVAMK